MVYKELQSSFVSLAWPWSGRSLPQGEPARVLGPWTGAQCGQAPQFSCHQLSDQPKVWEVDISSCGWLAGQLQLVGWLSISQNVNLTLPGRDILWPSVSPIWSGWPVVRCTPGRDILWPHVILLQVRLSFGQTFESGWPLVRCTPSFPWAEKSCDQVWYYFRSGWPVYWKVSLVPAAMVIPAPLAYIKVVAVKKLILSSFV